MENKVSELVGETEQQALGFATDLADSPEITISGEVSRGSVPRVPQALLDQLPEGALKQVLEGRPYSPGTVQRDTLLSRFGDKLIARADYKSSTTSSRDKGKPVVGWFFYKEAFAADLVQKIVGSTRQAQDPFVLDPFGGTGTVPFVCQELGIRALSVDLSPLPVFISNTKIQSARENCSDELISLTSDLLEKTRKSENTRDLPDVSIWSKAFDIEVAHGLLSALDAIENFRASRRYSAPACDVAHLALLCVAEEVSHAVKDGTSLRLRAPGRRLGRAGVSKTSEDLLTRLEAQLLNMAEDIRYYHENLAGPRAEVSSPNKSVIGDARQLTSHLEPNTFDLVITSPPYPNRYDYSAIYALELLLGFVKGRDELRALRFDLFRSHLEAPWPDHTDGLTPAVEEILSALYQAGMSSPRVFKMILGYFADLSQTLRQLMIVMKSGATAHFVVGNVRIEGQEVPVDLILAQIAEDIGFQLQSIGVARLKGTNSQQAKKFGNGRLRESVVEFRKP